MAAESAKARSHGHGGSSTSRSLLERLHLKEVDAWSEVVHLYSPLILYWCRRRGAREADCEDIMQDVFRTVATRIQQFTKDRPSSTFRGWLRTITHSRVADFYRRTASEPDAVGGTEAHANIGQVLQPTQVDDSEGEKSAEQEVFLRAIELIRGEFKEQTWKAFWRTAVDGCNATDVADELGMKPGAVRASKSRVLQRLRSRLGDVLD